MDQNMEPPLSSTTGGNTVSQSQRVTQTNRFPTIWPLLGELIATFKSGRSETPHRENNEQGLIDVGRPKPA